MGLFSTESDVPTSPTACRLLQIFSASAKLHGGKVPAYVLASASCMPIVIVRKAYATEMELFEFNPQTDTVEKKTSPAWFAVDRFLAGAAVNPLKAVERIVQASRKGPVGEATTVSPPEPQRSVGSSFPTSRSSRREDSHLHEGIHSEFGALRVDALAKETEQSEKDLRELDPSFGDEVFEH